MLISIALALTASAEIARVLIDHGAHTDTNLRELWSRIVFNMLVSNTDDHLRNHGFFLVPGKGWRLSKAYNMNPAPESHGLKLQVSQAAGAIDLARSVAPYFRVPRKLAGDRRAHPGSGEAAAEECLQSESSCSGVRVDGCGVSTRSLISKFGEAAC